MVPIKIFSWWGYISPEVLMDVNKLGFKTELIYYTSNETSLSRIGSKKDSFDVVIVAGTNVELLSRYKLIQTTDLLTRAHRNYHPFLNKFSYCVPYQWSTTVFIDNLTNNSPSSLKELVSLKTKKIPIGIVDDPNEFLNRLYLDHGFKSIADLKLELMKTTYSILSPEDFSSRISKLKEGPAAIYGWSGEAREIIKEGVNLKFTLAKEKPIVGTDYVCVAYLGNDQKRLKDINEFILEFTNEKNTKLNTKFNQYFSPYTNHSSELLPIYKELYGNILTQIKNNNYHIISAPDQGVVDLINTLWREVRFK